MKDDFFSFTEASGTKSALDQLDEFDTFTKHVEQDADCDLLSNWSLGLNNDEDRLVIAGTPLGDDTDSRQPSLNRSTVLAGFDAKFSLAEPLVTNSIWLDKPQASAAERLQLPEINDEIFGFRLLFELGAGAFAKVFLAMQGDLADREVVLKISAIEGSEPQTLAQLQHTHVVPIYSVHEDTRIGLRAVCMPYFGGSALSKVLEDVWKQPQPPVSGQVLLDALDKVSGPEPATKVAQRIDAEVNSGGTPSGLQSVHTARNIIAGLSYVQATAWIICRLAEGLQHSHERQVIHRDIKPSNILMSAESQPLLLDFNVSQAVNCLPEDASMGGTLSYMAPEHLRAMLNHDPDDAEMVNHRSDIYSLGLVLYEMLTGASPFKESIKDWLDQGQRDAVQRERDREVPSLKKVCKLEIPWSLESIVRKCLAPCQLDRYMSAAQLAEDLTRFLQDLPLKFAPELSRAEQYRKWARRHPRLTTTIAAALIGAALIIPGGIVLRMTRQDLATKQSLLMAADAVENARRFRAGALKSLYSINTITPDAETLQSGIETCRKTLQTYGVLDRDDWQRSPYWRYLQPEDRVSLAEQIRELLIVLADAQTHVTPGKQAAENALVILDRASRVPHLAPSQALELDRARYLTLLNRDDQAGRIREAARQIPAVTAYDLYMLGSAHAREGTEAGYRRAIDLLSQAIDKDPRHFWAYFVRALCQQEMGEVLLSVSDLSTCAGLWPESAWAHYNLGCLMDHSGNERAAIRHYTNAIKHDQKFRSAYFNRGLARLELREFAAAASDFEATRKLGRDDAVLAAAEAMTLEGLGQHQRADKTFEQALDRAESLPTAQLQRISWTYAFAVAPRAPQIARRVFEKIINEQPNHPQALYGRGMLAMQEGQLQDAVDWFDRSIQSNPQLIEPLRYRAIVLARLGKLQEAVADTDLCLELDGKSSETLYVVACVSAISARKLGSRELRQHAVGLLRQAAENGSPEERSELCRRAAEDPDLSVLNAEPEFRELTGQATVPAAPVERNS